MSFLGLMTKKDLNFFLGRQDRIYGELRNSIEKINESIIRVNPISGRVHENIIVDELDEIIEKIELLEDFLDIQVTCKKQYKKKSSSKQCNL
jgi:hypothetical protein